MKKILVAVDDTKGSLQVIETTAKLFPCVKPDTVVLLYVQKMEGKSVMDEMLLSDSEIQTLRESLQGTEYQEILDLKAGRIIDYYSKELRNRGITGIKTLTREEHPAEEILKAAEEEGVNLIIIGSRGKRLHNIFMGSVSREVANNAPVSVLIVK